MTECSACGTPLAAHETRCPTCGKPTAYYHRQRRCLNCGAPAAQRAVTCMMCGKPVDSLPLSTSIFSGSWWGVGLGVLIILGLVYGLFYYQTNLHAAPEATPGPSPTKSKPTVTLTPTPTPTITDTPQPTATFTPTPTPTPITYAIQSGDYPSLIADLFNVPVEDLMRLNNLDDSTTLSVGQILIIPNSASAQAVAEAANQPTPETITYIVQSGDTLLGIALDYDTTVEDITAVNPDTSLDLIFPGQEIVVPLAPPTPTLTPTIPPTASATPGPDYPAPSLLSPAAGQVVNDDLLIFNWTSTTLLAPDEYYVLQINWAKGERTEIWLKNSSWRISKAQRPANGLITWNVTVMRQTGTQPDGQPNGFTLSPPTEPHPLEWQ